MEGSVRDTKLRDELRRQAAKYCALYRNAALVPFQFHVLDPWDGWYHSDRSKRPGCYALFTDGGDLLYIGKASQNASIGSRLAAHFRNKTLEWVKGARWVQMIEVTQPFEAPSLEEYLIGELQPQFNRHGRRRDAGLAPAIPTQNAV